MLRYTNAFELDQAGMRSLARPLWIRSRSRPPEWAVKLAVMTEARRFAAESVLSVDTQGLVLKAKVHSAKVPDQDGLRLLLESACTAVSDLKHLWLDAGYEGRAKD